MKKIRKRYRLGTLVAGIFLTVCALLATVMPGASAASASAQSTSSPLTTVKLADSAAAASVATRSTAPSSPQGPKTRQVHLRGVDTCVATLIAYPEIQNTTKTFLCGLVATAAHTHNSHVIAVATAACVGGLIALNVDSIIAMFACSLAASPEAPFTQEQWCENTTNIACLNAWSGGPWVNDGAGGPETADSNQNFYLSAEYDASGNATGYYQIIYDGLDTSWRGQCIGDAYNNSGYSDTSLDPCGSASGGQGWGTNMVMGTSGCPSGESWFHDNHWNGYLGPGLPHNGSHFYLNKPSPYCFDVVVG